MYFRLLPLILVLVISACSKPAEDTRPYTIQIAEKINDEYDGDRALASVAELEQHIRWVGNTAFDAAIDHIAESLEAAGYEPEQRAPADARLTYRVEDYPMEVPAWQPIGATLRIEGADKLVMSFTSNRNMLANNSYSTPEGGVVVELVDVGNGTNEELDAVDVRGKAVLANSEIDELFEAAVLARGAAGVLSYAMPAYTNPSLNRDAVQFGEIEFTVAVESWGITLSFAAQEALRSALSTGPVSIRVSTRVAWFPNASERTVVADIRGSAEPEERFVFSAHVQEPGANDNASGVAAQLEMARVAAELIATGAADPQRSITFLWGDEHVATDRYIAQDPGRREFILWGLSMDMVGEDLAKTGASFLIEKMPDPSAIWTRGDESFSEWGGRPIRKDQLTPHYFNDVVLARALERAATNGWVVKTNPYEGGSDHDTFLDAGIPGLLLWHFTDPYYHTDLDRLDMVSAAEMKNVGVTALTTALTLASADLATSQQLIEEVRLAAIDRLRTETSLSVAAIRDGSPADTEREILETWAEWYDQALAAMHDIEVGGASVESRQDIDRARMAVRLALSVNLSLLVNQGTPN